MRLSIFKNRAALVGVGVLITLVVASAMVIGCASPGYRVEARPEPSPPQTRLYFYPTRGQSQAQQDRDRYECHLWAVRKSGFDPGQTPLAPHQRVDVIPEPAPGTNVAAGAAGGAVIGSILTGPRQVGKGLVLGAITGALLGAASDAAQQEQTRKLQNQYDTQYAKQYARAEHQSRDYQRAMSACLDGRGYIVR
jgi:hypothetical protein